MMALTGFGPERKAGPMAPRIESYEFGRIKIDGKTYTRDVMICPDGVRPQWWRKDGHGLHPRDLAPVMGLGPETIIIGSGAHGALQVPEKTEAWIREKGIELIVIPTGAACDRYNQLSASGRVIAGLHLTC